MDRPYDGLTALMDVDVLYGHFLLTLAPVVVESFELCGVVRLSLLA